MTGPPTPDITVVAFNTPEGWHAGYSAAESLPLGTTIIPAYEKAGGLQPVEIPPATKMNVDGAGASWWFLGGRWWGETLPDGAVALLVKFVGPPSPLVPSGINLTVRTPIDQTAGPLEAAEVKDGQMYFRVKPEYAGYPPAVSFLGRHVSVEQGKFMVGEKLYSTRATPPEGEDFHGEDVPFAVCVWKTYPSVSECSTRLFDIPLAGTGSGN